MQTVVDVDDEILETALRRKPALRALAEAPRDRRDLQTALDVSKTTCHRIVRSLEDHSLVTRGDDGYATTLLGDVVVGELDRFEETVETAYRLEPLLEQLSASDVDVDPRVLRDASVSWEVEGDGVSLDRGVERVREADLLRVMDWTPVPDLYLERIYRLMAEEGTRSEAIYPREEVASRLDRFPDLHDELVAEDGGHRYWVCQAVPTWGMSIYDDELLELRAYEPDTGAHALEASTGDPAAVEWAADVFERYREQSVPTTEVDDLPDWGDYSW